MPDWVKDVIRNASPRPKDNYSDLEKDLQELLNKYKVRVVGRKLSDVGAPSTEKKGRDFGRTGSHAGTGTGSSSHRTVERKTSALFVARQNCSDGQYECKGKFEADHN